MKLLGHNKLSVLKDARVYSITAADPRFEEAREALAESESKFIELVSKDYVFYKLSQQKGFHEFEGHIYFKTIKIEGALKKKVQSLLDHKNDLLPFEKFMAKILLNPNEQSRVELFDFLAYRELPITEDGNFLAYKGVRDDYYSSYGCLETKVKKGKVNSFGQIFNGIGEHVKVRRKEVNSGRNVHCSGLSLHAGSLDYAKSWSDRVVIVEINPKDAGSVPTDCEFQKLRCCAYRVISNFEEEISAPLTDSQGTPVVQEVDSATEKEAAALSFIETYIGFKMAIGLEKTCCYQLADDMKKAGLDFADFEIVSFLKRLGLETDGKTDIKLNQ